MPICGEFEGAVAARRRHGYDSGQATPDRVIVAAVFAAVLVSVTGDSVAVALRIAGVVRVLDGLGDFLDPAICRDKS